MDLAAVNVAARPELADFAVAAALNAQHLVADAELLAGSGRNARALALAVLAIEESGKGMNLASLACLPDGLRAQAPLRRLLEGHHMKLAGGLLLTALPFGNVGTTIAAMPAAELALALRSLAPADESDRLKLRGLYADMERGGRISEPQGVTGHEVAAQLGRARQATASAGGLILGHEFGTWLADPPAEALEIFGDLVTTLTGATEVRSPQAATEVILQAAGKFRARHDVA